MEYYNSKFIQKLTDIIKEAVFLTDKALVDKENVHNDNCFEYSTTCTDEGIYIYKCVMTISREIDEKKLINFNWGGLQLGFCTAEELYKISAKNN